MENKNFSVSVVIPAYNEELAIADALKELKKTLQQAPWPFEIIVVNDGSTDRTGEIVSGISDAKLMNNERNLGYGAAIKRGVRVANYDYIALIDADGQHDPKDIMKLAELAPDYDMVVGARTKASHRSWLRKPGLKVLHLLANYLVDYKIPDLNSGLRIIDKEYFKRFEHLFSDSFSLSTTSTLAFLKGGLKIKYVPIVTRKRLGKSTVKQGLHGMVTILLILRVIMVFDPLKIFIPSSLFFLAFGVIFSLYGIIIFSSLPNTGVILILIGVILFFNGLIADQISAIRRG
jgi:glycosyltransferase involved in cell wall biosynthesis